MNLGLTILANAQKIAGQVFAPDEKIKAKCAYATEKVLFASGIDIKSKYGVKNVLWVPDWENKVGYEVQTPQKGDLVFTEWDDYSKDHGHIGIYAGQGEYYNVSSFNGYKFTLTKVPVWQNNVMYRRLETAEIITIEHWATREYEYLKKEGLITGEHNLNANLTKGEAFAIFARILRKMEVK